jgi:hypothetical protein
LASQCSFFSSYISQSGENDELDSSKAQVSGLMTNLKVLSLQSFSLGGTIVEGDQLNSDSMTRWEANETFQLKFQT